MEAMELSSVQEKQLDYQEKVLAYLKKDQADKKQLAMRLQLLTLLFVVTLSSMVLVAVWLYPHIKATAAATKETMIKVQELSEEVSKLDFEALERDMTSVMTQVNETGKSVAAAGETIASLDVDSLNTTIQHLSDTVSAFASIDFSGLSSAIQTLKRVTEAFSSLEIFGQPIFGQ